MSDVLKIVGGSAVSEPRGFDGCDHHPMSAMWAGKGENGKYEGGMSTALSRFPPVSHFVTNF